MSLLPIGISDFRNLRELGLDYVDKTDLICRLIDTPGVQAVLLPRPRRFGKTVNITMLRWFFEKFDEDLSPLFEGLRVFQAGDDYRAHFQRYPVIYMTFKDIKFKDFDHCWDAIRKVIIQLFNEHRYVLDHGRLNDVDAGFYRQILEGTAAYSVYGGALADLSRHLHRYHGQQVVILIDEYDAPIHAGYIEGYIKDVLDFFRAFLTGGLKDNTHLYKAVLTGILRVARESIFSGLNNLAVYSLLRADYNTCFGFTEAEVEALLRKAGCADRLGVVRSWYNGYVFGGEIIYNPWSILNFLASPDKRARAHWVATSGNELIKELLEHHAPVLQEDMATLLAGGAIERALDENVVLSELRDRPDALFSLLVFSGYLRAEEAPGFPEEEEPPYRLSIPNKEVRTVYTSTFAQWIERRLLRQGGSLETLQRAVLGGDAGAFERQLQAFVTDMLSYHDPGALQPERVYQAFLIGLLAALAPYYQVRSNRESGHGRPDVLIRPVRPGKPGVVLELKVASAPKTLEQALEDGLEQIRENDYAAELRAAGASPVHAFAVAFDGKRVQVRAGGA